LRAESRIAKAVTRMKFWFMGEIVTDGVGHLRTYGEKKNLLTQRSRRSARGEIRD
jgi:hypothetical protein